MKSTSPHSIAKLVFVLCFVLATGATTVLHGAEFGIDRRPNVIVILADDQGAGDLGCYGAQDLHTPQVDRIADAGIRFTQFYSAAPVCSPSRAGLLTGRWPVLAGVPSNCASQKGAAGALPAAQYTIAEAFREAGYATAHVGKWHLGYTPETSPNAQGFLTSFGHMGGCIDNYSHFFFWSGPNTHDLWLNGIEIHREGEFFPDLMANEAIAFIEQNYQQPFFLYYALNSPHYPYQGEAKWLEHFNDLPYPRNLYAAFLASQDDRIGRLLDCLDQLDIRDQTIVVFQSDNGHSTEERAHYGGGSAGPYRGAKFSLFEGGIRLPAIISWPGTLPQGQKRSQVGHACDWFPTLLDLAGLPPTQATLDGKSLKPVLMDAKSPSPHRGVPVHWQVGTGADADWAVRLDDWKLIGRTRDTTIGDGRAPVIKDFLVNLAEDPTESENLAEAQPDIVRQLTELYQRQLDLQ